MDDPTLSEIDEAIWHAYLARDADTFDMFLDLRNEVTAGRRPRCAGGVVKADVTPVLIGEQGPEAVVPLTARPFDHGADWSTP
jgi:hypothetical protein